MSKYRQYVTRINFIFEFGVILKIDTVLTRLDTDIMYLCLYIPPDSSLVFSNMLIKGPDIIENILVESDINSSNCYVYISGDLNARVGEEPDYFLYDNDEVPIFNDYMDEFPITEFVSRYIIWIRLLTPMGRNY